MADKIKAIKIKQKNGTYTGEIPISVNVQNVQWDENNHTLLDALGSVDISSSGKGNLQHQIDELDGDKISTNQFNSRLNDFLREQISEDTTDWLDDNVNPVGSAVIVDKTLTINGAAADAKVVGNELTATKISLGSLMEPQRLADGTDLNTVTTPGTYTLHTSSSYVNKPTEDVEHGILEVWHEDFDNNLGRIFQRLTYTYKAERTCTEIWTRSKAATSGAIWTPWVSVVNADELNKKIDALMEPQRLADGTDFNTVTAPGVYTLHTSCTYTNKPTSDIEHGILEVWHEDFDNNLGRTLQRLTYMYKAGRTQTEIWTRAKAATAGATWTPWISTTGDLTRKSMLLSDDIPDTTQAYVFTDGKVSQVTHSRDSVAIRTDVFTYGAGTITEVRTLNTGESLTIVTNLTTLETIVTYNGGA